MSEQKQVEKKEDEEEEEIKPTKQNVSDEYYKGYRVGYNRAVKRMKRNKVQIEVKKDTPQTQKKDEPKKEEVKKDEPNNKFLWLIVAVVLGVLVFIYVVRTRNREPTQ